MAGIPESVRDCLERRGMKDLFESADVARKLASAIENKKVSSWIDFSRSAGKAFSQAGPCLKKEFASAKPDQNQECVKGRIIAVEDQDFGSKLRISVRASRHLWPPWRIFSRPVFVFEVEWFQNFTLSWPLKGGQEVRVCYRKDDVHMTPTPAEAVLTSSTKE